MLAQLKMSLSAQSNSSCTLAKCGRTVSNDLMKKFWRLQRTLLKGLTKRRSWRHRLKREIHWTEFEDELGKFKDGAPVVEDVRISAVKTASQDVKKRLFSSILNLLEKPAEEWPNETKEGWVIPLHKKEARNDLNNYRGVCLLSPSLLGSSHRESVRGWKKSER